MKNYFLNNFLYKGAFTAIVRQIFLKTKIQIFEPASSEKKDEIVILIHGLFHSAAFMQSFANFMAKNGYLTIVYDYRTTRKKLYEHADDLKIFINDLLDKYPTKKINLIAHSMGGLISRVALSDLPQEQINHFIMLATPNGGSPVASYYMKKIPKLSKILVRTLSDLSDAPNSIVHKLPFPKLKNTPGIIIAKYDKLVPEKSTRIKQEAKYIEVEHGHSAMIYSEDVFKYCLNFLKNSNF